MGFTFAFTESVTANIRQKDDATNGFAGGCSAGLLAGLRGMGLSIFSLHRSVFSHNPNGFPLPSLSLLLSPTTTTNGALICLFSVLE